ncbi:uncharacterized protein LOC143296981 isoform X2 [Babylonia areolata]|uniref:uncharacterized protein LOC143296981 isoform X2 n=1 Tax=Babylonia areolata TaxID=304850 RepID=UPI003FD52248
MSALQVKAVLLKEGVEEGLTEVRRFRMEGGGSGGQRLQRLLSHVHAVFQVDSASQQCNLYWKDNDGDLVKFSSEEEFSDALSAMSDSTFRVYITLSEGDTGAEMQPEDLEEEEEQAYEGHGPCDGMPPFVHFTDPADVPRVGCPGMDCPRMMGKKGMKAAFKMAKAMNKARNKEFQQVRQQVPEEFRGWVRQFARAWHTKGPEAARTATAGKPLPEGVPQDFPQWLHDFFSRHHPDAPSSGEGDGETAMEGVEGEQQEEGPEGLPPVYFRWLTLFLPRFHARFGRFEAAFANWEGEGECRKKRCHKGKHGCHGKRKGKHGAGFFYSESEDSDGEGEAKKKVPKEFRKYARVTVTQLHKKKEGDNSANKEEATRAGISGQVQEFVDQVLMEWHAKLTSRRPRVVAMEMMAEERTLPEGVEQAHFRWLCRFLARWHRRHAGKCDVMSNWSSGGTSSSSSSEEEKEGTSGDERAPLGPGGPGFGPWAWDKSSFRAMKKMMKGYGMIGCGPRGMGFGARGMGFGARGMGYGARGMGYGARGMGFGARGMGYGAWGSPHGMPGFGARGFRHGMMGCPPHHHACMGGFACCGPPPPPPPFPFRGGFRGGASRGCWMGAGVHVQQQDGGSQGETSGAQDDAAKRASESQKKM